ncbi:MAG: hypothetical protein QOJ89_868 [bacterium]
MADVALLLASCLALAVATGATTVLLRPDGLLDAAITLAIVAAAGVVAVTLAAGAAGALTRGAVLALECAWALAAGAAVLRSGHGPPRPARARPQSTGARWIQAQLAGARRHRWECAVVALAVCALCWQLLVALVLPPFAYDALTYHLTIVATWLTQGNLDPTPLSLCCARYPANAELLFTWPALFLGSDALVDTVQVGFAALAALAVAGIARSADLPPAPAAAAGALFAVTPIVLTQAPTNFADVIVAGCALVALHALVRFAATAEPRRLVVAGLATGLVLGTKGTGIIWAAVLVAAAVAVAVSARRAGRTTGRATLGGLAAFACAALALGGYWYARNWIETGNPVYPFRVDVAGHSVFRGPLRVDEVLTRPDSGMPRSAPVELVRSWAADLRFWQRGSYDYQQRSGGLGPLWPWLALALLIPVALTLWRRRSPALIAFAAIGVVLAIQPYRWWSRFTITLMAAGAIAIACAAAWSPWPWMRRTLRAAALTLALAGALLSSFEVDPAGRARSLPAQDVVGLIGAPSTERSLARLFFGEYRFLEHVPDDATVIVDLHAPAVRFTYPLFGPRFTRRVLPARAGHDPPAGSWVVTGAGRPLDRALRGGGRFRLDFAARGVRVYAPVR